MEPGEQKLVNHTDILVLHMLVSREEIKSTKLSGSVTLVKFLCSNGLGHVHIPHPR